VQKAVERVTAEGEVVDDQDAGEYGWKLLRIVVCKE